MKHRTLLLLLLLTYNTHAQLSGRLETIQREPIPFANVLLLAASDSSLIKGTLTNESGEYKLENIVDGNYFLRFSAPGFTIYESVCFSVPLTRDERAVITLRADSTQLDEVMVRATKPLFEQKIDRTVINVESSVMTKGSSVIQLLERSPGVLIDMRTNTISMNGKSGVMVMLNGKTVRMPMADLIALLNGTSANDIEKIELITTPPANYDADGTAGLINIVMKKKDGIGTTGSMSVSAGYGWGEKAMASISVAHNTNTINVFGAYSFLRDRMSDGWDAVSTQDMPLLGGEMLVTAGSHQQSVLNGQNISGGIDLYLKKTTLGTSINYSGSKSDRDIFTYGNYHIIDADSLLSMRNDIHSNGSWHNILTNIFIEQQLRENEKINVDLDHVSYSNNSPTDGITRFFNTYGQEVIPDGSIFSQEQRGSSLSRIGVSVIKIDYTRQLNPLFRIEAGLKGTYTRSSSVSSISTLANGEWHTTQRFTNDTDMNERIGAAYASLSIAPDATVSIVAGLRYEHAATRSDADKEENRIDRVLGMFFPGLFLSRKMNEQTELQLSYTKRISRPTFNDLGSYLLYLDPMAVATGNPSLKPTVTNNIRIALLTKGYSFSLMASRDDYPIVLYQLNEAPAQDLMYNNPQNMRYQNNLMLQTDLPVSVTKWWSMNIGINAGLRRFKLLHTEHNITKTYGAASLNGRQTFLLPRNISIEISGWYNSPQYEGSKKIDGFGMLNAGIKKDLKSNRGSFQLTVTDIFKSMRVSGYFGEVTEEAFSLKAHFVYGAESYDDRIIRLSYTRTFGNGNRRSDRGNVSKDERDRIRRE